MNPRNDDLYVRSAGHNGVCTYAGTAIMKSALACSARRVVYEAANPLAGM